ncbi:MAG: FRG domain-containing protein [Dechloromonas sp.]|uniref:FRG domain-containing protein n=1 Tax=Dechloromonas sp. TaxID=1917218 RepID=UPI0027EE46DD|nr:FRG domain-containing protein [Dechloromonas sp.]MBT9519977.1 FRG domain-containing protein [Dechloromonas sp.]
MSSYHDYWDYYNDEFDWPDGRIRPDLDATRQIYDELGIPAGEAHALIASGFVHIYGDTIIDRYYGGALINSDGITRISKTSFRDWYQAAKAGENVFRRPVAVSTATSLSDLEAQVKQIEANQGRRLLFRGQTMHHETTRQIKNPALIIEGLGEASFIPSVWRNLLKRKPDSFHNFEGLSSQEWSRVIDSQFDINEINRRVKARRDQGEWISSAQDMEDSDDPILSLFGRVRMDLSMGHNYNLADLLNTLLQHYGLDSPYLDLSSDLDIALFFSSHKFVHNGGTPRYRYVGNNESKSILYVFREDKTEMAEYAHDRVLHELDPLRPKRQSCVICRSSPYALNLAGLYLVAAIRVDFELPLAERRSTPDLFPDSKVDSFLAALLGNCTQPERITNFQH